MAECVISSIVDTDIGRTVPACVVHAAYAPCRHNGEPACSTPLHADTYRGREDAIQFWDRRTRGQRVLVLHHGDIGDETHHLDGVTCWCGPEVLGGGDRG